MPTNKKILNGLKSLLEKNIDAAKGFTSAAKIAKNATLIHFLQEKSNQRNSFAVQLSNLISKNGGDATVKSSYKGAAHRIWMDISVAISSDNDEAVLEACEEGDRAAIKDYNEFLDNNLIAAEIRNTLAAQHQAISKTLSKIKNLENSKI